VRGVQNTRQDGTASVLYSSRSVSRRSAAASMDRDSNEIRNGNVPDISRKFISSIYLAKLSQLPSELRPAFLAQKIGLS